jgi:biopolymer transport protein ExbD
MRLRRSSKLLVEPPSAATGDIAFNLIVFFLVCASIQPDSGRQQTLPKAEQTQQQEQQDNITVELKRSIVLLDGDPLRINEVAPRIKTKLTGRTRPEDRVIVVKSADDVPYHQWVEVTTQIEDAGGIITLQLEEERQVEIPQ